MKNFQKSLKVGLIVGLAMFLVGIAAEWNIRSWIDHGPNIGGTVFTLIFGGFVALPLGIIRNLSGARLYELVGGGYLSWMSWVNAALVWFVIGAALSFLFRKIKSIFFKSKSNLNAQL